MSGGGRPRSGKMGTSIRVTSVSGEAIAQAENELTQISEKLRNIESLKSQHEDLAKQCDSLKAAAEPSKAELTRFNELMKIISKEEKEIKWLIEGSKQLKEKVLELQSKIENAGGERLKNQKGKVNKIQNDIDKRSTKIN